MVQLNIAVLHLIADVPIIDEWILADEPSAFSHKDRSEISISVYRDIRTGIVHSKKKLRPLDPNNPDDIKKIEQHIPGIRKHAERILEENLK